jgi:hypothetical protein
MALNANHCSEKSAFCAQLCRAQPNASKTTFTTAARRFTAYWRGDVASLALILYVTGSDSRQSEW